MSNKDKLGDLQKITLITGAINYVASNIDTVLKDIEKVEIFGPPIDVSVEQRMMSRTTKRLAQLLAEMVDCVDGCGFIMPIDAHVLNPILEVINGKDEIEGDFNK